MTETIYTAKRKDRMGDAPELISAYFARIDKGKLLTHQEEIDLSNRLRRVTQLPARDSSRRTSD
jgi:sigma-70-like protein